MVYKTVDDGPVNSFEVIYDDYKPDTAEVVSQKAAAPEAAACPRP